MTNCVLCGRSDLSYLILPGHIPDKIGLGQFVGILECRHCGLVFCDRAKSLVDSDYYREDRTKDSAKQQIIEAVAPAYLAEFKRRLDEIERLCRPGRILDVGCGFGNFLGLARQRGWETYGIDISAKALQVARKKHSGVTFWQGTLETTSLQTDFFDVVTLWDVIEHLPNPVMTMKSIRRILVDGGLLVIKTPNQDWLGRRLSLWLYKASLRTIRFPLKYLWYLPHFYYFRPKTITLLLERTGFELMPDGLQYETTIPGYAKATVAEHYRSREKHLVAAVAPVVLRLTMLLRSRNKLVVFARKKEHLNDMEE
jgi:SAM-dependent methyltransferase